MLQFLRNEQRRLQTFVANRVEEIKKHSPVHYWKHVARTLNPADCVKGLTSSSLTADHSWLRGPDFLWGPEHSCRKQECRALPREDLELKKETHVHSLELTPDSVAAKRRSPKFEPIKDPMDDLSKSYNNLLRLNPPYAQGSMALTTYTVH